MMNLRVMQRKHSRCKINDILRKNIVYKYLEHIIINTYLNTYIQKETYIVKREPNQKKIRGWGKNFKMNLPPSVVVHALSS